MLIRRGCPYPFVSTPLQNPCTHFQSHKDCSKTQKGGRKNGHPFVLCVSYSLFWRKGKNKERGLIFSYLTDRVFFYVVMQSAWLCGVSFSFTIYGEKVHVQVCAYCSTHEYVRQKRKSRTFQWDYKGIKRSAANRRTNKQAKSSFFFFQLCPCTIDIIIQIEHKLNG